MKFNSRTFFHLLGLALLEIKSTFNDTKNVLGNWQEFDETHCAWTGISCHSGDEQRVRSMYADNTCTVFCYLLFLTFSAEYGILCFVLQKSAIHATWRNYISQHW